MTEPTIKGASIKGMQEWARKRMGAEFPKVLAASPKVLEALSGDLLRSRDYPTALQNEFLSLLAAHFGPTAEKELRAMGANNADVDLGGIYRIFLMLFSTSRTLDSFVGLWRKYQNTGEAVITERGEKRCALERRDPYSSPEHSVVVAGYIHRLLELAGVKVIAVTCSHPPGTTVAKLVATWR